MPYFAVSSNDIFSQYFDASQKLHIIHELCVEMKSYIPLHLCSLEQAHSAEAFQALLLLYQGYWQPATKIKALITT